MSIADVRIDEGIAIVTINNPPVNTGNAALRAALLEAFQGLVGRDDIEGAVLTGSGANFYSGSDLKEFDGEISLPPLTEVIDTIEALSVPVVAAINGVAFGGGLEVALGCDIRISEPGARVALPETTLGMLPGAGGTVRLPRLIGVPAAIRMIAGGVPIRADEAQRVGLLDAVVASEDLLTEAKERARSGSKRLARTETPPAATDNEIDAAIAAATPKRGARPNVVRAIELVRTGIDLDPAEALARERAVFNEFRVSDEARNLRYLFFAKRAAAKGLSSGGTALDVTTVGIGGAGTMGAAIAAAFLASGRDVVLYDIDEAQLTRAADNAAERGASAKRWGTLTTTTEVADLASAQIVIDAVVEDMRVKTDFFRAVEAAGSPRLMLASNTSYLDLDELASSLKRPERLAGLHFFAPADRNPLVELVRPASVDDETMATLAKVIRSLGKSGIAAGVGDGFVANRVYADYRGQAELLVEDGASPWDVDNAMTALGLPMGPFAVGDMSGLDIAWSRRKRLAATRDSEQRYVTIADKLCESGRLGRKTGAGWYSYPDGASRGVPDPAVDVIVDEARRSAGVTPRQLSTEEIQQRIVCAMVVAAAHVVFTGIAKQASDIDVAFTEGFGFPKWLGGPVRFAAHQTDEWLLAGLRAVHESDPIGYRLAEPSSHGELPAEVVAIIDAVS